MLEVVTLCEVEAVPVLVPPEVVPCQYIVPPEPPDAVRVTVADPHALVPPLTDTAVGTAFIVTV